MIDTNDIQTIIEECLQELENASRQKYDSDKAEQTASKFLVAQLKASILIEDVELKSKQSKNEVSRLEAEKYYEIKISSKETKLTETTLTNLVAKNPEVVMAKDQFAIAESNSKKWYYILNTLKDGHIFFRNINKSKTWSE